MLEKQNSDGEFLDVIEELGGASPAHAPGSLKRQIGANKEQEGKHLRTLATQPNATVPLPDFRRCL